LGYGSIEKVIKFLVEYNLHMWTENFTIFSILIQGVSGGRVNILGGGSVDHAE
jgi:hypothetical protein